MKYEMYNEQRLMRHLQMRFVNMQHALYFLYLYFALNTITNTTIVEDDKRSLL